MGGESGELSSSPIDKNSRGRIIGEGGCEAGHVRVHQALGRMPAASPHAPGSCVDRVAVEAVLRPDAADNAGLKGRASIRVWARADLGIVEAPPVLARTRLMSVKKLYTGGMHYA